MKWVEENPAGILRAPKVQLRPTLPFTGEEWRDILAAVGKDSRLEARRRGVM